MTLDNKEVDNKQLQEAKTKASENNKKIVEKSKGVFVTIARMRG